MKYFFSIVMLLFISKTSISQDIPYFKLTNNGVLPINLNIEHLTINEKYSKSLLWINENYINPKDAIIHNSENKQIKVEGFKRKAWWYKSMGIKNYNHMFYAIEFSFNNNLININYSIGKFYMKDGAFAQYDYRMFFKKDGTVRNQYIDAVQSLELTMNELLLSYYNFLTGESIQVEEKDLNKYSNTIEIANSEKFTNPDTLFELACLYSLLEDSEKAYEYLSDAVAKGFKPLKKIHSQNDLKWLRHQSDFEQFVSNGYKLKNELSANNEITTTEYLEELKVLSKLKEDGVLTEKEFEELKAKIIERVKNE